MVFGKTVSAFAAIRSMRCAWTSGPSSIPPFVVSIRCTNPVSVRHRRPIAGDTAASVWNRRPAGSVPSYACAACSTAASGIPIRATLRPDQVVSDRATVGQRSTSPRRNGVCSPPESQQVSPASTVAMRN